MAYAAVSSLLQSLDYLIKFSPGILDFMITEARSFVRKRINVPTVFPNFDELSEENQLILLNHVRDSKMDEIQSALEDLQTLLSIVYQPRGEPVDAKEYDTGTETVWKFVPQTHGILPESLQDLSSQALLIRLQDENGLYHLPENQQNAVRKFILDCHKFKMEIISVDRVYRQAKVLFADLCYLLTYLDDSLNVSEGMLECIKLESDKAKKAIEEAAVSSQKNFAHLAAGCTIYFQAGSPTIFVSQRDCGMNFKRIESKVMSVFNGGGGITGDFAQAVEQIKCIKAEISSKQRNVDEKVPSMKSHGIPLRDPKEEIVVDVVDEELILERLVTNDTQPGLEVVSIVGMGGIGKTTLAKKLFDHSYTGFHFDCRAWCTVSQVYVVRDLLLALISFFAHKSENISEKSNAELCEYLYRSLKCKRYLIVVDDIWSIDAWNDVKRCFPDDKSGSRVIVTSRFIKLANLVSHKPPHFMNLFDTEKSWELLQKLVCRNAFCSSELEKVGRKIAKRCRGLPLAIVVIAGILCSNPMTLESWSQIAENLSSIVVQDPEQCLDILALSYVYLPFRLRACFLYMGAFPDDCEIEAQKLINLWVAEGFLFSRHQKNLEQVAEEYLEDLIGRNLIMVEKRSYGGRVKTCRLHDFVRELCLIEARKENFMNVIRRGNGENSSVSLRNQQRLSFHLDPYNNVPEAPALPQVSSFLCFSLGSTIVPDILFFQLEFKLLRVLDVYYLQFEHFPELILRLVHLRYLALNVTFKLPDRMSLLTNLQTFVIQGPWLSPELDSFPTFNMKYWFMPSLRHLHTSVPVELMEPLIKDEDLLSPYAPKYIQTLSVIRFSSCRRSVFEIMPSLKKLHLCETKDDYMNDRSCHLLNNLVYLQELVTLKCCFYPRNQELRVMSCLDAFSKSIRHLSLSWSYLPWEDMPNISRLPNLQVLKLKNHAFHGPKWLVAEEGFPNLECLLIANSDLVHWDATVLQFPRLRKLVLKLCSNLEEIPFYIDAIGSLHHLEMHYCSSSIEVLAKDFQEQVEGVNVIIRTNLSQQYPQTEELLCMKMDELSLHQ